MEKLKPRNKNILSLLLLSGLVFSVVQITRSAAPNPGHVWSEIGTGGTEALSASRGGTGTSTLAAESVILGNGTGAVKLVAPGTSGNLLTSNGTSWTSATSPSALTGAVFLLSANEVNSSIQTDTANATHKFWVLNVPNTTYSYYLITASVNGNEASNTNVRTFFNWHLMEGSNLLETYQWAGYSFTTSGVRNNSVKFVGTIKTLVAASAVPNSANFSIIGNKNQANTRITLMVHSFRVYGIK
jgi:hypothetical protein